MLRFVWRNHLRKHRSVLFGDLNQRFYHSINGVFGNYNPLDYLKLEKWYRNDFGSEHNLNDSYRLVKKSFEHNGHLLSKLDPLEYSNLVSKTLNRFNLSNEESLIELSKILGCDLIRFLRDESTLSIQNDRENFLQKLLQIYCEKIGYEITHVATHQEYDWIVDYVENGERNQSNDSLVNQNDWKERVVKILLKTEVLDDFLAKKFQSVKRYGLEGAETMLVFIEELIQQSLIRNQLKMGSIAEIVIGMPHRGRLNLMTNLLDYPFEALFNKMFGGEEFSLSNNPKQSKFIGDVLSHLYTSKEIRVTNDDGTDGMMTVTLLPNPSHLEVIAPMVCGYSRGQLLSNRSGPYARESLETQSYPILPIQIHGDASFTGQGIIMETLAMSNVEHFCNGGSIHLIVNNQIGYTTPGRMYQSRSSLYCSDPMKMIQAPVIHVNGDHPESVIRAARMALAYRQQFHKDIAIDLVCFRLHGHNELDDPTFTNPSMYDRIRSRQSIPQKFAKKINWSDEKISGFQNESQQQLNECFLRVKHFDVPSSPPLYRSNSNFGKNQWNNIEWPSSTRITKWNTAVSENLLQTILSVSIQSPPNWSTHRTLTKVFDDRLKKFKNQMDWATAESLAFGSLLCDGFDVRISGQDVGRGTFSQRHCMIVDQKTNDIHIPLNELENTNILDDSSRSKTIGKLEVCNSILSEEAVLAYEYGLSLSTPNVLSLWEAQFGDFFNGAQTIIDTLISSGEAKWLLQSSLTMLLPNGYDGAGPEHTSARLERFLQQSNSSEIEIDSDDINWSVCYPTTPAQYFHLIRRQMLRKYRKPLIVMSPKILLRNPRCVSNLNDLSVPGSHFRSVLDDERFYLSKSYRKQIDPIEFDRPIEAVRTIVFCSGKHYYTLEKELLERFDPNNSQRIALIRLEELCPFPVEDILAILKRYPKAKSLIWSQEEHRNMGAWSFVEPRFRNLLHQQLKYVGRDHLEAPAVGITKLHQEQNRKILNDTFAMIMDHNLQ
ncbi:hypothetical protein NH340_JMT07929 [Sarcoptes scabiei]|nr:hypothetical protein NH340_JMT07929 [Sarcoptes scabiei]